MHKEKAYYGFLDTLRTLAIGLVLLRHTIRPFLSDIEANAATYNSAYTPIKNLMANGWVGVDLFFLLSGFLIAQPFLNATNVSIQSFYKNRILRIFPAYFFVLILVVAGLFPYYDIPAENLWKSIMAHIAFMQDYAGADINVVFWSLGVEIKFYLIAPLILIFTGRYAQSAQWKKAYLTIVPIIILAPFLRFYTYAFHDGIDDYAAFFKAIRSPFHMSVDGLFFGVLLALIFRQMIPHIGHFRSANKKRIFLLFMSLSCGGSLYFMSHDFLEKIGMFDAVFQPIIVSVLFLVIALSGLCYFPMRQASAVSRWGAKLSYSLYLVHWPLIPTSLYLSSLLGFAHSHLLGGVIFMIILWSLSLVASFMIYYFIEAPFLKLKEAKS